MRERILPRFKSQTGHLPGSSSLCSHYKHNQYNENHCAAYLIVTLSLSSSTGMLKRTKYSRLRNDSLTSLEDRPQRMLPLKRDLCIDSDFAQLDPGTPTHHGPSTLRDFIPRVANIRLQSPISLRGLRGQTNTAEDRATNGHTGRPLSRTECNSGPNQRFCSQPSLNVPLSTGQNLTHSALNWCFVVTQSMRTLDFDTRMQVTR
uniref:Uncharacterized protein n=1 Tax=Dicentrarchus labrax TaxID=13489 RepID=A0A8C4EZ27_DICLA